MKVLSLLEPWATLVAIGAKKIETRSWSTSYRGPVAIYASKAFGKMQRELVTSPGPISTTLCAHHRLIYSHALKDLMQCGHIICVTSIVDCVPTTPRTFAEHAERTIKIPLHNTPEFAFGDYSLGRYMWMLGPVRIIKPVPAKGSLGLWNFEGEL